MGGSIKICGQHANTSCRRQAEEKSNTVHRRGVRRHRAGLVERKAMWESTVLSVRWRGSAQECVLHTAFLLESPGQRH